MTDNHNYARLERENLQLRAEAMLGGAFGIAPGAIRDIADRLLALGLENVSGRLRLPTGEPLRDAVERMRSEVPMAYFTDKAMTTAPAPAEIPVTLLNRRKRAANRLSQANRDRPANLDGGSQ